MIAALIHCNR